MDTKEYGIPDDVANGLPKDVFLPPNTPQNSYIWSRCLTEMREKSIFSSSARICAGGKLSGYKGKMPGVLEEIVIAIAARKPIFLLGGFGGCVSDVCKVILDDDIPDAFTEKWQISHNAGYSNLQDLACSHNHGCDYKSIVKTLQRVGLSELSARAGLEKAEYEILMSSTFIDECVHLIVKGISNLKN